MSGADYIYGLLAIVTGLAICDMIVSLHGLLMNRRYVKWDWLTLVAAACVLLLIINTWRFTYVAFQGAEKGPHIWVFLIILTQSIGLYLAARAVLPDRVEMGEPFDLGAYYDFVDRYLWSALSVAYASFLLLSGLGQVVMGKMLFPNLVVQAVVTFVVILSLVIWPNRKLHRIVVPLLLLSICIRVLPARLLIA